MMKNRKSAAIKTDLFAHEAHHQKLDELGDPLQEIERHVDFATLAAPGWTKAYRGQTERKEAGRLTRRRQWCGYWF